MADPKRNDTQYNLLWKLVQNTAVGTTSGSSSSVTVATPVAVSTISSPVTVSGRTKVFTAAVPNSDDSYVAGDTIGAKITLADAVNNIGGTAILHSLHITDGSNLGFSGVLLLFDADPSGSTVTDADAFSFAGSLDELKVVAAIPFVADDFTTGIGGVAMQTKTNLGVTVAAAAGTSLYAVLVSTDAWTSGGEDLVTLRIGFLQD